MKTREMAAVIESLQREHSLLAAYLEAADKIDSRSLHKRMMIGETPKPINAEAHQVSDAPQLPEAMPLKSSFALRRANLVRSS